MSAVGALLGLLVAAGIALVGRPRRGVVRLVDRVAPFLGEVATAPGLGPTGGAIAPAWSWRAGLGRPMGRLAARLDRALGGRTSVARRLRGLGATLTVEDFRLEQLLCGVLGAAGGAVLVGAGEVTRGRVDPVLVLGAALGALMAGGLGRDWYLSYQLRRREQRMLAEFPVVADLLALAVVAGEAPPDALQRVCRLTGGELARDLGAAVAQSRVGVPLARALTELGERTTLPAFSRFLDGMVISLERGTPLAEVLRAQAIDVRELSKRELLEAGGRKEISMMVPVVFLILPVTVLFALYPGLLTLTSLAR